MSWLTEHVHDFDPTPRNDRIAKLVVTFFAT